MGPGSRVEGTLLCHAGVHRIAFAAHEVASIAAPGGDPASPVCSARRAFREREGASRVLVATSGEAVGVDALEIDAEVLSVLPPPRVVAGVSGGSLRGFVLVRGLLWPLVGLADFERYLRGLSPEPA